MNSTASKCPKCGNTWLLRLSSLRMKLCTDCNTVIPWELKDKQPPLVKHQR